MSKFIERLKKVSQPAPQPMGFRVANAASSRPKIQLVANLSGTAVTASGQLAAADALIFPEVKKGNGEIPRGWQADDVTPAQLQQAQEAGADFVVFPVSGTAVSGESEIGKVLRVETSIPDVMLRMVNELPLDAVLVMEENSDLALTWQRLMVLHRFAGFISKPLLAKVPTSITAEQLKSIWDIGFSGVVVDIAAKAEVTALKQLRQVIDGLSYPEPKKTGKFTAVVPRLPEETARPEPDEDDDGEDDDI